jgi:hypothetical protein
MREAQTLSPVPIFDTTRSGAVERAMRFRFDAVDLGV